MMEVYKMVVIEIREAKRHARAVPMRMSGSPIELPMIVLLASARPRLLMNSIVLTMAQMY